MSDMLSQLIAEKAGSIPSAVSAAVTVLDGLESVLSTGTIARQQHDFASARQHFASAEQAARGQCEFLEEQQQIAGSLLVKCQGAGLAVYAAGFNEALVRVKAVMPYAFMRAVQAVAGAVETEIDASPVGTPKEISRLRPYMVKLGEIAGAYQSLFSLVASGDFREMCRDSGSVAAAGQHNVWANGLDGAPSQKFRELCSTWVQMCGSLAVRYQDCALSLFRHLEAAPQQELQSEFGIRMDAFVLLHNAYNWFFNAQDAVRDVNLAGVKSIGMVGEVLRVRENVLAYYGRVIEAKGVATSIRPGFE